MIPEFDELTGYLPPGRYRVDGEQARLLLVDSERFAESQARSRLWDGLGRYLTRFFALEQHYAELLDGRPLLHCLWLGGSFVSTKLDPANIDTTVMVDDESIHALKGKPHAKWLTEGFERQSCLHEFGVSPIELRYRPIASAFRSRDLPVEDQTYFRERGAWDDWWQRCRPGGLPKTAPTLDTAKTVRGYLEVTP